MKRNLSKKERETIIIFNEEDELAEVRTYNRRLKNALAKCSAKNPGCYRKDSDGNMELYVCPKELICVRSPRLLSEKTKQKLAEKARVNFSKG